MADSRIIEEATGLGLLSVSFVYYGATGVLLFTGGQQFTFTVILKK